jgi:6-pyruvoyltetrahydropterin/6-carboxytetrahydropterin synthase
MYRVTTRTVFSAMHQLRNYRGATEPLHSHDWKVEVTLEGENLNSDGLLVDFTELEKHLDKIKDRYEGGNINEIPPFDQLNPTAELLAKNIADELIPKCNKSNIRLCSVRIEEAHNCFAEYLPD